MRPNVGQEVIDITRGRKVTAVEDLGGGLFMVYDSSRAGSDAYYEVHQDQLARGEEGYARREACTPAPEPTRSIRRNPFEQAAAPRREPARPAFAYEAEGRPVPTVSTISNKNNEERGRFNMNIKRLFGEFGRVNNGEVVLTLDGKVAVKRSAEEYVRYDAEKEQIVNHMNLVLDSVSKFFYVLPVTKVEEGDVIRFKGAFYQVLAVTEKGVIKAVNLKAGTTSTICKETNAFGINFYYKVTSLLGTNGEAAEGINPMMFMLLDKDSDKFEDILPLMLLTGNGFAGAEGFNNPLLLMTLLKEDGGSDMKDLMMLQMLGGQKEEGANAFSNPLVLMSLLGKDGGSDMKDIMMMQMLSGNQAATAEGNPFANPMVMMMLLDK